MNFAKRSCHEAVQSLIGAAVKANCLRFSNWAEYRLAEHNEFYCKITFLDAAYFHLGGYVKRQIVASGVRKIHKSLHKSQYIHNESLFGVDYGLVTLAACFSSEMIFTEIEHEDIINIWFQQDGGKNGDTTEQLDLCLWWAVKGKCYAHNLEIVHDLKAVEIYAAIAGIRLETIENWLKNCVDEMRYCQV